MSGIGFGSIDYEGDEEDALPFEDEPADWQGYDWTPREGDEEFDLPPPISDDDVVAEPVDVVGGSNLVPHGSFETASGWEAGPGWQVPYAWDLTGTPAAHGTSAARISAVGIASALQSAADIPVDITRPYHISAMGMMTAYTSGEGRLVIVEYDASAQVVAETVLARQTGLSTGWVRLAGVMVVRAHSAGDHVWHPETVMVRVRLDLGGVPIFDWRVDAVVMTQGDVPMTFAPRPNEDIPGDAIIPGTVKRPQLDDVPPGTPTGLTFVPSTQTLADGTTDVIVTVTLAHPDDDDYVWSRIEITRASEGGEADPEAATPVWSGVLRGLIGKGEEQTVLHGLVGGARYWGRARAEDITGNLSDWTEAVRFDATRDLDAPPVPTDVTAIPGFRLVGLHWSPALADDLSYYDVRHRVSGSDDDWLVSRARSTSIVVTDLDPEHMYDFNVRAVDLSGQVRTSATDPRPVLATDDSVGWSETVTAQPTLVGSSDIAASSVTATHIAAGAISADSIGAGYIVVSTALDDRPDGIRVVTSGGLESARWDEDGLVIRETPGDILRHVIIDGGAIRMTTDGGDLVTPQGSYQTAITPDGINASAIRLGEVPGGHNIVRNASFELNEFLTVPEEVTATDTGGTWGWNGTFRTGVSNVTEGTSLSLTKSAYADEPSTGMSGGASLVAPPATLAASGTSALTSYLQKVLSTSPVVGWPMDEVSGDLADAVGSVDAVVSGSSTPTYRASGPTIAGDAQWAVTFDGNDEFDAPNPGITSDKVSVLVWFKASGLTSTRHMVSRRTTGNESWHIFYHPTNDWIEWRTLQAGNSAHASVGADGPYDDGAWHGAIGTMEDGVRAELYIDDPDTPVGTDTSFAGSWNFNTTAPIDIGHFSGGGEWVGSLCHIWIWDRLLTSTERTLLLTGT